MNVFPQTEQMYGLSDVCTLLWADNTNECEKLLLHTSQV